MVALPSDVSTDEDLVFARVPAGAGRATAELPGSADGTHRTADGVSRRVVGPRTIALCPGDAVTMRLGEFELGVEAFPPSDEIARAPGRVLGGARPHVLVAALVHAGFLGLSAHPAFAIDEETRETERIYAIQCALEKANERELAESETDLPPEPRVVQSSPLPRTVPVPVPTAHDELLDLGGIAIPDAPVALPDNAPAARAASVRAVPDEAGAEIRGAPRETIHRVVRQGLGRIQACYDGRRAPAAEGTEDVMVRFDVAGGQVEDVRDAGSTVRDRTVVGCVARAFSGLSFPLMPEDGRVRVTYPIAFRPASKR